MSIQGKINQDQASPTNKVDRLDCILSDVSNLVQALQYVCWEMVQIKLEKGSDSWKCRNAVVGLADAMEATIEKRDKA